MNYSEITKLVREYDEDGYDVEVDGIYKHYAPRGNTDNLRTTIETILQAELPSERWWTVKRGLSVATKINTKVIKIAYRNICGHAWKPYVDESDTTVVED